MAVASEDDAIGVIWRFGLAVRDRTAKRNLRLLAKTRWQKIAVRINADVGAATHDKISTGRAHDKFGIAWPRALADDLHAVRSAGAYGSVMASTYNGRLLVPEAQVNGTQFAVVRPQPDYDAMLSGDTLAPWQAEEAASRGAA